MKHERFATTGRSVKWQLNQWTVVASNFNTAQISLVAGLILVSLVASKPQKDVRRQAYPTLGCGR